MDREDARIILIKELKCNSLDECNLKCDECGMLTDPKDLMEAYEVAIRDIKEMDNMKEEWIPVSERLPKAGEYVGDVAKYYLVQNEYGDMLVARYTHSEYWEQIYQLKPYSDRIIAWRELPESYKEEREDKK